MIWIWSTLSPLLTTSQVQSPIVASDIEPPLPKIGSHRSKPYFDKSWYGYLHAAIKNVVTKTLIMIRFKRISFHQAKHSNFDTLSIEQPVFSSPSLGPFSVSSLSNYNRTELQVSIFIIFPWRSVIFLLNSISAYSENVLILKSETLSYDM